MITKTKQALGAVFPALTVRNFQLYFLGQSVSLIGFWLQSVALGYLMFQLTHSPFQVGLVATASGLPFLLFSTFAGVYIDRANKQKILVWTQTFEALIALALGLSVFSGTVTPGLVLFLSFLTGICGSIDIPTRFSFIVEMVGKEYVGSAVSLNIAVFNGARFVGPAIAGLLIASFGTGWAFVLNALSYIPGIMAVMAIRPVEVPEKNHDKHPWESYNSSQRINEKTLFFEYKEGLKFAFTHTQILILMILASCMAIFIWPYQTLMPIISEVTFRSGPAGLGSLLSATGLGSLFGAVFTSAFLDRVDRVKMVFGGLVLGTVSLLLFSLVHNFVLAHLFLFAAGFGVITVASSQNTLMQQLSPAGMRGRVNSVYLTAFVGMMPLGNALAGFLAEKISAQFSIGLGAVVSLVVGIYLYLTKREKFRSEEAD